MTGMDDLRRIAPTSPDAAAPDWQEAKARILDETLASRDPRRPGRWVTGLVAATVVVAAVATAAQFLPSSPSAVPASPSTLLSTTSPTPGPTTTPDAAPSKEPTQWAKGSLFDRDGRPALCAGAIGYSSPPTCQSGVVELTGVEWSDISWRLEGDSQIWALDSVLLGIDHGDTFEVLSAMRSDSVGAPEDMSGLGGDQSLLCGVPTTGEGNADVEDAARSLAAFIGAYQTDGDIWQILVTGDVPGAYEELRGRTHDTFCVTEAVGPTEAEAAKTIATLAPLSGDLGLLSITREVSSAGSAVLVQVVRVTEELIAGVEGAVGVETHVQLVPAIADYTPPPPPTPTPQPGDVLPHALYTHCGLHWITVAGQWYERDGGLLDDGSGNPPPGWGNPTQDGQITVEPNGDLVFTDALGHREVFLLRPEATGPDQLCA